MLGAGSSAVPAHRVRVGVVADGPPLERTTNSGVARGFARALSFGAGGAELSGTASTRLRGWRRSVLRVATVRPTRRWWWFNANFGVLSIAWRSILRERFARRLPDGALVVHVRNVYLPSRVPYVAFIDQTLSGGNDRWSDWRPPTRLARRWLRFVEGLYYRRAAIVMTAGAAAKNVVIEDFGIPAARVVAIGGGVNFDDLPQPVARTRAPRRVLFVGMDWERKGGDVLVEAFRRLAARYPDARLTLVGGVPSEIASANIEVLGVVRDRDRMAELYRDADLFCLPARYEPYGLVVQEAMAFGLPVVVSAAGELPSIVGDEGCGLVVADPNPESLAAALAELMSDGARARALGTEGRARVEREFTWDKVVSRAMDAIRGRKDLL